MSMFDREQLYNASGVVRTKSLFRDFGETDETILTLNESPHPYPSLGSLYVKFCVDDPSEATFVEAVFGDFIFWEKLKKAPCVKGALPHWKHEADVRRKSKAFAHIMKEIEEDGRNAYQAAKFLIDEPWKPKTRASKESSQKSTAEATPSHVADLTEYIKSKK